EMQVVELALLLRDLVVGDDAHHGPASQSLEHPTDAGNGPTQLLVVGPVLSRELSGLLGRHLGAAESGQLTEPFDSGGLYRDPAGEHVGLHGVEQTCILVPYDVEARAPQTGLCPPQTRERPSARQRVV